MPTNMETLLHLVTSLPMIFSYWTGVLIVWSVVLTFDIKKMIKCIYRRHSRSRFHDKLHMWCVAAGAMITSLALVLSVLGNTTLIDIFFGVGAWYTGYLIYVTIKVYTSIVRVDPTHISENHKTIFDFFIR